MTGPRLPLNARIRHEPDRSYTVLVQGPDGVEEEVGSTRLTRQLYPLAQAGAARLHHVPVDQVDVHTGVFRMPQPPYGHDGQLVRIISAGDTTNPDDLVDVGMIGQISWFGREGGWWVVVAWSGAGIHPSEHLDFDPVVTDEEAAELTRYLDLQAAQQAADPEAELTSDSVNRPET